MAEDTALRAPAFADIEAAALALRGQAAVTPLLEYPDLNASFGARILIKPESLQRTGSFKFRGAYNCVRQIAAGKTAPGVVAFSSGNHAQGVAAAAALFGLPATIVMPADAPRVKLEKTRRYGAEVVTYDRLREDRSSIAQSLVEEKGFALVKPFDDPRVIAGQGTVGLEIANQAKALDANIDILLSPCGGGGLISGIATALETASPQTAIYAVEPDAFDDTGRSLRAGKRRSVAPGRCSICDALLAPVPGELTFDINRRLLAGGLSVSDDEVRQAVALAVRSLKLVVEPGGAVALAALLSRKFEAKGKTVALVLSGGNIDTEMLMACLNTA
jgi:threonine dehydratase